MNQVSKLVSGQALDQSQGIARRFSRVASKYHQESSVQREVAQRLASLIRREAFVGTILDVGCGTGWLTSEIAKIYPSAEIDALDISPGMLEVAREFLGDNEKINYICADARDYSSSVKYDLVVSSAALHWMQPLDQTLGVLSECMEEAGAIYYAVMLEDTLGELHKLRRDISPETTPIGALPCYYKAGKALGSAGFDMEMAELEDIRSEYSSAVEFFRTIRELGVTTGNFSHGSRLLNRKELIELKDRYQELYSSGNGGPGQGVYATYSIGYFSGRNLGRNSGRNSERKE